MVGHIANTKAYGGKNSCDVAGNGRKNETLHNNSIKIIFFDRISFDSVICFMYLK